MIIGSSRRVGIVKRGAAMCMAAAIEVRRGGWMHQLARQPARTVGPAFAPPREGDRFSSTGEEAGQLGARKAATIGRLNSARAAKTPQRR